jgi:hypothetical protein
MTSLITKARQHVTSYYGIPGNRSQAAVKTLVSWLTTDGRYKYGGIDLEVSSFFRMYIFLFYSLIFA